MTVRFKARLNYIPLGGWLRLHYAYIDLPSYRADSLFTRHKVRVKYGKEYARDDQPYRVIFCSIRNKDRKAFEKAMDELVPKMELLGNPDYTDSCDSILGKFR